MQVRRWRRVLSLLGRSGWHIQGAVGKGSTLQQSQPIASNRKGIVRVFTRALRLPLSSGTPPQLNTEDGTASDPFQFRNHCFCFRSLTANDSHTASPVANYKDDVCQYQSIRCLRRVELGDVPSCAESCFRCWEQKDADGSDKRATTLHAELCQHFQDIDDMYTDAIEDVKNVQTTNAFTTEDQTKRVAAFEGFKKDFATRREVACEGTANGTPVAECRTMFC